ncbi:hypothetical protein ACL6C3_06285 [Capilliphycus salinus ALCB114379]|uniref:hypothetical protein n=1 Tax=Capilliphycus salinus TaxID=2768948 RepID=UPI0039A6FA2C
MSYDQLNYRVSAPCIIDTGIVVNKSDMQKLLVDLGHVRYLHIRDGQVCNEAEGYVLEVFASEQQATLVANHALYLNVNSFDYLELKQSPDKETYFDLVQEGNLLRLIPLSNALEEHSSRTFNAAAIDAVMDQVLSGNWDSQLDEDCPF